MRMLWPALAVTLVVAWPATALAQADAVRRVEVTGAFGLATGAGTGDVEANLRANSTTPQPFALFTADSHLGGGLLGEARVAVAITPRFTLEGRVGYSRPELRVSVRTDTEGAAPVAIVERIDQYVIDGGIIVRIDEVRIGGWVPYVAGGAGYLRQLHEGLTVIEEGHVYHLGGGVKRDLLTRARGFVRAAGLRADARVYILSGGAIPRDRSIAQGLFTAGVFVRF